MTKRDVFTWEHDDSGTWQLRVLDGCVAATVWSNGAWSVWDCDGVGGENSIERDVATAKDQAARAVALAMVTQGWHSSQKKRKRKSNLTRFS